MIKERGIPFQPDMALAAFEGRKTQTRRIINPQPMTLPAGGYRAGDALRGPNGKAFCCPYGGPGERLWVREPWRTYASLDHLPPRDIEVGAGVHYESNLPDDGGKCLFGTGKYRHGRFMCRWMSRTLLEVTSIRIERLQDISEADAKAEGAPDYEEGVDAPPQEADCEWSYRASFMRLWDSINAERAPWSSNPWLWVVAFKRVK